jgi:hypothetical protein
MDSRDPLRDASSGLWSTPSRIYMKAPFQREYSFENTPEWHIWGHPHILWAYPGHTCRTILETAPRGHICGGHSWKHPIGHQRRTPRRTLETSEGPLGDSPGLEVNLDDTLNRGIPPNTQECLPNSSCAFSRRVLQGDRSFNAVLRWRVDT